MLGLLLAKIVRHLIVNRSAFAQEAQALAAQQDAANRFAALGMQRRFG